jgi:hypothetical protein
MDRRVGKDGEALRRQLRDGCLDCHGLRGEGWISALPHLAICDGGVPCFPIFLEAAASPNINFDKGNGVES